MRERIFRAGFFGSDYSRIAWLVAIIIVTVINTSCSNDAFYEEFREVKNEAWDMADIKEFPVHINDTSANYRLIITIRNTTDYAYSNLYMFFTTINPDQTASRDTIECLLADRYGNWLGKGFGKIRENRFLIRGQYSFPDTGDYFFTLEHGMRDEVLEGITDIGLRIEKIISPY
jgi:gliding motility-associated lipoprotein GldH